MVELNETLFFFLMFIETADAQSPKVVLRLHLHDAIEAEHVEIVRCKCADVYTSLLMLSVGEVVVVDRVDFELLP